MAANGPVVYQFKVTLQHFKPKTWRRILVPEDYTFFDLHVAIQSTMRWNDSHLHQFHIKNRRTGEKEIVSLHPRDFDFMPSRHCKDFRIKDHFMAPKALATYEYDLGASWMHDVELEKIVPAKEGESYPQCVAGKNAGPSEDCGGYEEGEDEEVIANQTFDPEAVVFQDPKESTFWDE